jgi:hypothetical protein
MPVQTLGEAWKLGWRLKAHCYIVGRKPKTTDRTTVWCDTGTELDPKTLVWTRGEHFPLDRLASRLKCPRCGLRQVHVFFEVPGDPNIRAVRAAE